MAMLLSLLTGMECSDLTSMPEYSSLDSGGAENNNKVNTLLNVLSPCSHVNCLNAAEYLKPPSQSF